MGIDAVVRVVRGRLERRKVHTWSGTYSCTCHDAPSMCCVCCCCVNAQGDAQTQDAGHAGDLVAVWCSSHAREHHEQVQLCCE